MPVEHVVQIQLALLFPRTLRHAAREPDLKL